MEFESWLRIATTPANAGAPAEVPPTTTKPPELERNPLTQLPPEQMRYPSWPPDAFKEMSGTSRALSLGTPAPVCQFGFAKYRLRPPPPAVNVPTDVVSFQTPSGMRSEERRVGKECRSRWS